MGTDPRPAAFGSARKPLRRGAAFASCLVALLLPWAAGWAADDLPPALAPAAPAVPASAVPDAAAADGTDAPAGARGTAAAASRLKPAQQTRIEQKIVGRRVSEVIVTPGGFTYHYSMDHLQDQEVGSVLDPHPQLSVPRFFRFDF